MRNMKRKTKYNHKDVLGASKKRSEVGEHLIQSSVGVELLLDIAQVLNDGRFAQGACRNRHIREISK